MSDYNLLDILDEGFKSDCDGCLEGCQNVSASISDTIILEQKEVLVPLEYSSDHESYSGKRCSLEKEFCYEIYDSESEEDESTSCTGSGTGGSRSTDDADEPISFKGETKATLDKLKNFLSDILTKDTEIDYRVYQKMNNSEKLIVDSILKMRVTNETFKEFKTWTYDKYIFKASSFKNIRLKIERGKKVKSTSSESGSDDKEVVRLDQAYKMVISLILKLIRFKFKHLFKGKVPMTKKELSHAIFEYYFKRKPNNSFNKKKAKNIPKKETKVQQKECEAEALFYVKHGVTKEWFMLARDGKEDKLSFLNDCQDLLNSKDLLIAYQKRINKMLDGLLGLEAHSALLHFSPEEALNEVLFRIKNEKESKNSKNPKNPKCPVSLAQFIQAIEETKKKFLKHTPDSDKKREERKQKREARKLKKILENQ